MTEADKVINPRHFGNDPADIRIRINPEIWIQILDRFWLIIDALAESVRQTYSAENNTTSLIQVANCILCIL